MFVDTKTQEGLSVFRSLGGSELSHFSRNKNTDPGSTERTDFSICVPKKKNRCYCFMQVSYVWHSLKCKYNTSTLVVEAHIKPHAHIWHFDQSN